MKYLISVVFISFFGFSVQAADVVCSCKAPEKCADIKVSFVPANPGVYLSVEYAYGRRNQEGFARVTRDDEQEKVIYQLGQFTIVEQDGKYSMPLHRAVCN